MLASLALALWPMFLKGCSQHSSSFSFFSLKLFHFDFPYPIARSFSACLCVLAPQSTSCYTIDFGAEGKRVSVSSRGAQRLAEALLIPTLPIQSLNLSYNCIGPTACHALGLVVTNRSTLTELRLAGNPLGMYSLFSLKTDLLNIGC